MGLDWVEVECPKCGRICAAADVTGEKTETERYHLCPVCAFHENVQDRLFAGFGAQLGKAELSMFRNAQRVFAEQVLEAVQKRTRRTQRLKTAGVCAAILAAAGLIGYAVGRIKR